MTTETQSLQSIAREISEAHEHDEAQVVPALITVLRNTPAYLPLALEYAANALAQEVLHSVRSRIDAPPPNPDRSASTLHAQWQTIYDHYLQWPLANGVPLAKATKAMVSENALRYRKQGRTMLIRADWLASVAAKMGRAETVGEKLDGQALHDLYEKAEAKWAE